MIYIKQVSILFSLVLFLQASHCSKTRSKDSTMPMFLKVSDKNLVLGDQEKNDVSCVLNQDPEFDPEFDPASDPDFYPHDGVSSGSTEASSGSTEASSDSTEASSGPTDSSSSPIDASSGYKADTLIKPGLTSPLLSDISDISKSNVEFDFESWIQKMRKTADENRNIKWYLSGDELTRVVDNSNKVGSLYAPEDYVVQGLNIYRAAKKICALHAQGGSVFSKKAYEFIQYYSNCSQKPEAFWINTIKNINKAVVLHLQRRLFKDESAYSINSKLRLAENYVGLNDTHYNVTTIFKIEGKKFALEDKKWLPLTKKQKQAYLNRKLEKWYKRLSLYEQKFIDDYVYNSKLLNDKCYIPAQLRSILGSRNAYKKRILAYDENNNPVLLGGYYHSGSLASPIEWSDKDTDLQVTKGNWEQIVSQDKNVEVISLNYNRNILGFNQLREKKIVEDTMQVVGADRFINLSINDIGTSFNFSNQCNKLIEQFITLYRKKYPDICSSFNKDSKNIDFLGLFFNEFFKQDLIEYRNKQIEKIKDPKDKSLFRRLGALKETASTSQVWNNLKQTTYITDNPNAVACSNYIACKAPFSVLFSCKSGKDRTGLMSYWVDGNIICMNHPYWDVKDGPVYKQLAYTGHYQFLASVNGGMPGRFGMKSVKVSEICRNFTEQLFPEAAKLTVIPLG